MHPGFAPFATRPIELVRADVNQGGRMPMICRIHHDQVGLPGIRTCQPQRQFIGFAGRIDEVAHLQRFWQMGA